MGKLRPRRISELVAKVGEDPGLSTPHQMLLVLHLAAMSRLGMFQAKEGDEPLRAGSQQVPGHCACLAARKQFPSVNLAFHSPLARSHILSHVGPTLTMSSPSVFWRVGFDLLYAYAHPGGRLLCLGEQPLPLLAMPPPPLLACFFPALGKQGPFCF